MRRGSSGGRRAAAGKRGARRIAALIAELEHAGRRSRVASAALEKMGPAVVPHLLRAYDSPVEHLRWEIVNLLGYLKDARAVPLLAEQGVQDDEVHPRWRSIWALSSVDDGTAVARLKETIRKSRGRRRYRAAVALSLFEDPAAVPPLRRGLSAPDAWDRWESASCLIGFADAGAARIILGRYRRERDADVKLEMLRALEGVDDPAVRRFLRRRLREDTEPARRSAAARALARLGGARIRALLASRLRREPEPAVRREIREALAEVALSEAGARRIVPTS